MLASDIAKKAHELTPKWYTSGFYCYDDSSPLCSGGTGGFLWFVTREAMHDFIARQLPFWYLNPSAPSGDEISRHLRAVLSQLGQKQTDDETVRKQLNIILVGSAQIVWWGLFSDLISAGSGFTCEITRWFRAIENSLETCIPLTLCEQIQLARIIKEYGA